MPRAIGDNIVRPCTDVEKFAKYIKEGMLEPITPEEAEEALKPTLNYEDNCSCFFDELGRCNGL